MALKIQPASVEELESEFGSSPSGNDPDTVQYIRGLEIGQGFSVSADADETDRMVKRRINACAKEAFRELDWRTKSDGKTLAARVKTIDTDAQKKWVDEQAAKAQAQTSANGTAGDTPPAETPPAETPPAETPPAETPPAETPPAQEPTQEPARAAGGRK